jgi:hypothetical protein
MLRKGFALILMALGLIAATPAARAHIDIPGCFPCDGK